MSTNKQFSLGGAITFWSLGNNTNKNILEEELKKLSLDQFAPEARTPFNVLKTVLEDRFGSRNTLVRPLESRTGFAVVGENRGDSENTYEHQFAVKFNGTSKSLTFIPDDVDGAEKITERYINESKYLYAPQVSLCLVRIVESLGGIPLRPRGAIYWIPKDNLDRWKKIASAIEKAGNGSRTNSVYMLSALFDESCVKAVRDGLINDIRTEISQITEVITSGTLKKRALKSKLERLDYLHKKVKSYESDLNILMGSLHDTINDVEKKATYAMMTLAGSEDD